MSFTGTSILFHFQAHNSQRQNTSRVVGRKKVKISVQVTEEALRESVASSAIMAPTVEAPSTPDSTPAVAAATTILENSQRHEAAADTAQIKMRSPAPSSKDQSLFLDELIQMRATVASLELENARLRGTIKERNSDLEEESTSLVGHMIQRDNQHAMPIRSIVSIIDPVICKLLTYDNIYRTNEAPMTESVNGLTSKSYANHEDVIVDLVLRRVKELQHIKSIEEQLEAARGKLEAANLRIKATEIDALTARAGKEVLQMIARFK